MIERKTVIDQVEITRSGNIQIRFGLLLVEDGVEIDCKWHRTVVEPGADVDAQLALVDVHLQSMGIPAVETDRLAQLKGVVDLVHTPELIEARAAAAAEKSIRA